MEIYREKALQERLFIFCGNFFEKGKCHSTFYDNGQHHSTPAGKGGRMSNTRHGLCVLTVCMSILLLIPDMSQGGNFLNSIRHGVSSARHRVERSYNHAREKTRKTYQSTSRRVKNSYKRKREQAANFAREKDQKARERIERDRRLSRELRMQRQRAA